MRSNRVIAVLAAVLVLAGAAPALAAPAGHSGQARMDKVALNITATGGTVWGKVWVSWKMHTRTTTKTCSSASCTYMVPSGMMLHLRQQPTNAQTWPFKDWNVTGNRASRTTQGATVSLKVTGNVTVTAVYVVGGSSSSSGPGW